MAQLFLLWPWKEREQPAYQNHIQTLCWLDNGMCGGQTYLTASTEVAEDQERWEMFSVGKQEEQMRHSLDTS